MRRLGPFAQVCILGLLILLSSFLEPANCQTQSSPLPEYFGIYAVSDGKLVKLDSSPVQADKVVRIRVGQRSGVGNVLQGQVVATAADLNVPQFSPNLKIIVFAQRTAMESPLDIAKTLHLESFRFIRNLTVDTGWPEKVRRQGTENGWDSGDAPELLGAAERDNSGYFEFLISPVPGHSDMVIAAPSRPLGPGVYRIRAGLANPFSRNKGLLFAVAPVEDATTSKCMDAVVTYSMNISKSDYTPCGTLAKSELSAQSQQRSSTNGTILLDNFEGSSAGQAYGITYRNGAVFSRTAESRIEYHRGIPKQGTLEWQLKIESAYRFDNYVLRANERCAVIFSSDVVGGDVTWPGATKFIACNDGELVLDMAQAKYNDLPHQQIRIPSSQFRFGQWHSLGISYGSNGQAIMLDGRVVGSAPSNTQGIGAAGTHDGPADIPTLGETVSHYWEHRRYSGGFEGTVAKFRSSNGQRDWLIAKETPNSTQSLPTTVSTALNIPCNPGKNAGFTLSFEGQRYRVLKMNDSGPQTNPVFLNASGTIVQQETLVARLATAVWVHDNIIIDSSYRLQPRSQLILDLIQTSIALRGYQHVQDELTRGSIDLLAAVVSDGTVNSPLLVVKSAIESAKPGPTDWMLAITYGGLLRSSRDYQVIENKISRLHGPDYAVADMEEIFKLYLEAWGLEQTFRPLMVATEPTHWSELGQQAMQTAGSETLNVITTLPAAGAGDLFLDQLFESAQQVKSATDTNPLFTQWAQGLKFSRDYSAALKRMLNRWATRSGAC